MPKWAFWVDLSGASHKVEVIGPMEDGRYVVQFPGWSLKIVRLEDIELATQEYKPGVYLKGELIQESKEGEVLKVK